MRLPLTLCLVLVSCFALAQPRQGTYGGAAWRINEHHTLIWDNTPYLPIGARIDGTAEEIAALKAAGITDALVQLPASGAGWSETFARLDTAGMTYVLSISSLAPMAGGYAVEPQGYRITGITAARTVTASLPGAETALAILSTKRDGDVQKISRVTTPNGRFMLKVEPLNDLEHILLIYPEARSLEQPDFWEGLDRHRDMLISALTKSKPGKGLRGIVNPMGTLAALPGRNASFVPSSPYFRYELRSYLESKYRNVETAQRAWSMSGSTLSNFDELSRLVPLWLGAKGISKLWDPANDRLYPCDMKRSVAWRDIQDVITLATSRRYQRLAGAIRAQIDVPVIQEWVGWSVPYEGATLPLDGIGMRAIGSSASAIAETACRATSSILRWPGPGWLAATEVDLGAGTGTEASLPAVLDDLASLGARGVFVRTGDPKVLKVLGDEAQRRRGDAAMAQYSPRALFYPENATNPAVPQRLTGGYWWLPSPGSGNRVDLGSQFSAYRLQDTGGNYFAIWTSGGKARYKLRMMEPKNAVFTSIDGTDPKPKIIKFGVEVTLSEMPLLISGTDEIPVPEQAYYETIFRFDELLKIAETRQRDATEERFFFKDSINGFERNPGGAFTMLRAQFNRLSAKLAQYTWIEAEATRDTSFSETTPVPGASGGFVLSLKSQLRTDGQGYYAEYRLPVRSDQDQEVWIAARVPSHLRQSVKAAIGGQTLGIEGDPISPYGAGFAWYRLGTTRLGGGDSSIQIQIDSLEGADIAVDAIVLSPAGFIPRGVTLPDAVAYPPMTKKPG